MTVTINLPPELESRLRERAARVGVDPEAYVVQALRGDLRRSQQSPASLSFDDLRLLQDINVGLQPETWARYRKLRRRRLHGTLTSNEHRELIALSDQVEEANANRLKVVVEYAQAQGRALREVMKELGIGELAHV